MDFSQYRNADKVIFNPPIKILALRDIMVMDGKKYIKKKMYKSAKIISSCGATHDGLGLFIIEFEDGQRFPLKETLLK